MEQLSDKEFWRVGPFRKGLNSCLFSMSSTLGYVFIVLIPLSFLSAAGTGSYRYSIGGHILFYELAMFISLPCLMILFSLKKTAFSINKLDILVVAFVFASLIPVIISWDILYISARDYRHNLFVPLIAYFFYKACFQNIRQVFASMLALLVPIFFLLFIISIHFLTFGTRAGSSNFMMLSVPLGVLLSWGITMLLFHRKTLKSRFLKFMEIVAILSLSIGLVFNMTRAAIFWLIVFFPLAMIFLKRQWFKKFMISGFILFLCTFFLGIYFVPMSKLNSKVTSTYGDRQSFERLTSPKQFEESYIGRVKMWKGLMSYAMESPLYGKGLAAFHKLKLSAAHPHNLYVSSMLCAGVIGLVMLVLIICCCYSAIFNITTRVCPNGYYFVICQIVFTCFSILVMVGFTNDFIGSLYPFFFLILAVASKTNDLFKMDIEATHP